MSAYYCTCVTHTLSLSLIYIIYNIYIEKDIYIYIYINTHTHTHYNAYTRECKALAHSSSADLAHHILSYRTLAHLVLRTSYR